MLVVFIYVLFHFGILLIRESKQKKTRRRERDVEIAKGSRVWWSTYVHRYSYFLHALSFAKLAYFLLLESKFSLDPLFPTFHAHKFDGGKKKSKVRRYRSPFRSWVNPEKSWNGLEAHFFRGIKREIISHLPPSPFPFGLKIINFCVKTGSPLPQRWQI